jgi:hypothetical protein
LSYLAGGVVFSVIGIWFVPEGGGAAVVAGIIGGFAFWSLILASILLMNYLLIPARARRAFAQQKALHHRVEVDWSDEGVGLVSEQGDSNFDWQDFVMVEHGRDVILLFQSEYLFNFIPRRAFPAGEAADFIQRANSRRS